MLATLSDGDAAIGSALRACWPAAPHQRCQVHVLNNLAAPVLEHNAQLRRQMRDTLGDLGPASEATVPIPASEDAPPPFCPLTPDAPLQQIG